MHRCRLDGSEKRRRSYGKAAALRPPSRVLPERIERVNREAEECRAQLEKANERFLAQQQPNDDVPSDGDEELPATGRTSPTVGVMVAEYDYWIPAHQLMLDEARRSIDRQSGRLEAAHQRALGLVGIGSIVAAAMGLGGGSEVGAGVPWRSSPS